MVVTLVLQNEYGQKDYEVSCNFPDMGYHELEFHVYDKTYNNNSS